VTVDGQRAELIDPLSRRRHSPPPDERWRSSSRWPRRDEWKRVVP
jgi:hypothetical protein